MQRFRVVPFSLFLYKKMLITIIYPKLINMGAHTCSSMISYDYSLLLNILIATLFSRASRHIARPCRLSHGASSSLIYHDVARRLAARFSAGHAIQADRPRRTRN